MNLQEINVEKEIKIVYMGTPEFSAVVLSGLIEKYNVRAIVTQPDRPVGRKGELKPTPVKQVGLDNVISVLQPTKVREIIDEIRSFEPDMIITCAFGQFLPKEILDIPRLGCINVHASLLPKLRGGAPIHHAILDGYKTTGMTIMYMAEKMDDGDIISQKEIEILDTDTTESLHDKLAVLGRDLLLETLPNIIDGTNNRVKQNQDEVTFGFNIKREDEKINFDKSKREVFNKVRGLYSWPGAFTTLEGKILKVWSCYMTDNIFTGLANGQITSIYEDGFGVKVDNGEVVLTCVQLEGKKKVDAKNFANGYKDLVGKILG